MSKPTSASEIPAQPPHVDPGYPLVRAIAPNAATLVHNAIMDMLQVPPAPRTSR